MGIHLWNMVGNGKKIALPDIWPVLSRIEILDLVPRACDPIPGPEDIKLFSCSTQLSTKFQLLIKTKIPTNEEVSCVKSLRCCNDHANKC